MYFEDLAAAIATFPGVADWRLTWSDSAGTSLGIKDNHIGSVYAPLAYGDGRSGSYLLQWDDRRLSRGGVDGSTLAHLDEVLGAAREAAYHDPDAAIFLGPDTFADLPSFDLATERLLREQVDELVDLLRLVIAPRANHTISTVSGHVGAGAGQSGVMTSRGLNVRDAGTSVGWSAGYDRLVGDGDSSRSPFNPAEVAARLGELVALWESLQQPPTVPLRTGPQMVLFSPGVAGSLAGHYLWGNLSGSKVFHGQSAFTLADFEQKAQRFRSDISLRVDPLRPMTSGSFTFTSEGLPAAPETYIENGRLVMPTLNLKYARKLGWRPTTPPGGPRTVFFDDGAPLSLDEGRVAAHILVLDLLGLHTQDSTTGQFSLSAPTCLLLTTDGHGSGRMKIGLSGNYFELLNDPATRFVRFPHKDTPGLLARVTVSA
ncbi:MAG: metallopeptidase TldD-related protein [Ardenticatenaceae bacterium]|nr:metallopeptidase TldD-related protein [Ardenticatenaceae bacterium]